MWCLHIHPMNDFSHLFIANSLNGVMSLWTIYPLLYCLDLSAYLLTSDPLTKNNHNITKIVIGFIFQ